MGKGGFVQCGYFWTRREGFFRCGRPQFLALKNFRFESFGVLHGREGRGVKPVQTFYRQGVGQYFAILCGRLLWTAPYEYYNHSKVNLYRLSCLAKMLPSFWLSQNWNQEKLMFTLKLFSKIDRWCIAILISATAMYFDTTIKWN